MAGCGGSIESFRVPGIIARNLRETAVELSVQVVAGDAVVFDRTVSLAAATYEGESNPATVDGETWRVDETFDQPVTLRFRTDSGEWTERTLGERAEDCVRPIVEVERSGGVDVAYTYTCRLS